MSSVVEKSSVSKKPTAEKKKVSVKAKQTEEVSTPVVQQAAVAVVEAPKVEAEQVVNSSEESGFKETLDQFNDLSDKLMDITKAMRSMALGTKENRTRLENAYRKFLKSVTQVHTTYPELLNKQCISSEKTTVVKATVKKVTDKSKAAVNMKLPVDEILTKFMGVPSDSLVSRAEALQAITGYVKTLKQSGNTEISVEGNNRAFKIVGDLKTLFAGIEKIMKERGNLKTGENMPEQITYIQIMKYMNYCFKKVEKK